MTLIGACCRQQKLTDARLRIAGAGARRSMRQSAFAHLGQQGKLHRRGELHVLEDGSTAYTHPSDILHRRSTICAYYLTLCGILGYDIL
ncbi:hypothetical protein VTO42DRAFT_188 [Malbranchea cinnamomea]